MAKPRPFCMLARVVARYIKGHRNESWYRNIPASLLLKNSIPIFFPKKKKIIPDIRPIRNENRMLRHTSRIRYFSLASECAYDTAGNSMVESELVSVAGNMMKGKAIPVNVPYIAKLTLELL